MKIRVRYKNIWVEVKTEQFDSIKDLEKWIDQAVADINKTRPNIPKDYS